MLKANHQEVLASDQEQFYGILNQEGIAEYGPSFQVVQSLHGNLGADTYFAEIKFHSQDWVNQGGCLGIQLMDSLFQIPLALPTHDCSAVAYAGGFEVSVIITMSIAVFFYFHACDYNLTFDRFLQAAHFIRTPVSSRFFCYLTDTSKGGFNGRRRIMGDFLVSMEFSWSSPLLVLLY